MVQSHSTVSVCYGANQTAARLSAAHSTALPLYNSSTMTCRRTEWVLTWAESLLSSPAALFCGTSSQVCLWFSRTRTIVIWLQQRCRYQSKTRAASQIRSKEKKQLELFSTWMILFSLLLSENNQACSTVVKSFTVFIQCCIENIPMAHVGIYVMVIPMYWEKNCCLTLRSWSMRWHYS